MFKSTHIRPLTGLRFFAAIAIVLLHSSEDWHIAPWLGELALNQGVSFFFVLSGFILTYVYRNVDSPAAVMSFYVARIARIYPVHVASTLLLFVLMPTYLAGFDVPGGYLIAASYFTLTHAWVPLWKYFLAFNGVSWSISTEFAFYLLFPFFVVSWGRYNAAKLGVAALPAVMIVAYINLAHVPATEWTPGLTVHGLIYIFPLSRLVEFVAGVVTAKAWLRREGGDARSVWYWVGLELAAVVAAYIALRFCRPLADMPFVGDTLGVGGAHWLRVNGFTPAFAFVIYVFARSSGPLARFLGSSLLFKLGEISFSLYMVHTVVLTFFRFHSNTIQANIPVDPQLLYIASSIACAYGMWYYVETPVRRAVINVYHGQPTHLLSSLSSFGARLEPLIVPAFLVLIATTFLFPRPEIAVVNEAALSSADVFRPSSPVVFDNRFQIAGLRLTEQGTTTKLEVFLVALKKTKLDKSVGVHLLGKGGELTGVGDIPLDRTQSTVPEGTMWQVSTVVPSAWISGPTSLGLAIYDSSGLLVLTQGTGDMSNHRYRPTLPQLAETER